MYENANNDNQFNGFGANTNGVNYQVGSVDGEHAFNAATSETTSVKLMTVQGNGNVWVSGKLQIGYSVQTNAANVNPSSSTSLTCSCPTGTKVLGGGWTGASLDTIESRPTIEGNGWVTVSINHDPFNGHALTTWAICARLGE